MAASMLLGDHPIVKELIFCKLCNEFFKDPRVLPCQHTFCLKCLQAQFQTSHSSMRSRLTSLRCPQCYTTAAIPLRGIHQFPNDTKVEKIKELLDAHLMSSILKRSRINTLDGGNRRGDTKSRPSSWTGNVDVTEMAANQDFLVNNTSFTPSNIDAHQATSPSKAEASSGQQYVNKRLPETKEASTDTGEDKSVGEDVIVNNNHEEDSINLEECGIQTDLCDVTKNLGYEVVLTDNMDGQSARKRTSNARINQNGVPLSKRTCPSNNKKDLHHQVPECDKDHKSINQEEGSSGLSDTDFDENNDVLHSVGNEKSDKNNHTLKKETTSSINNTEAKLGAGDEEDQVDSSMADKQVNGESVENHMKNGLDETDDAGNSTLQPLPVYTTPATLQWKLETQEYNMPTSIAITSNGNVVVSEYGNCNIKMYEGDGTYIVTLDDIKPYAMALAENDDIVVADRKDKTVKFYDCNGSLKYEWERDCFDWISGISVTSQGYIVVFDREDCKVGIFTAEGEKITQFGHYGDGDSHLCMADFLTVDGHDRILICDSGHHCIKVYDLNGSFLGRFGERGTQEGFLLWPKSVCVDGANNILVTDQKNNRVNLYSPDGVFIQTVIPSYPSPFGVCYGSPDTLGLTNFNLSGSSCVSVYKL